MSSLQPETRVPRDKRVSELMAASGFVPGKRLEPFANQGVIRFCNRRALARARCEKGSAVRAEQERLAVEKPSDAATHGGDLNEGTSQSGAFARRAPRNAVRSCKALAPLVTTDCRPADLRCGFQSEEGSMTISPYAFAMGNLWENF